MPDTAGRRIKVLVVDDEESYREAMSSGLHGEGFEVDVAPDGASALRRFVEHPPDIVLLDMRLPDMRGNEVCRRMRAMAPVPVVMVTAVDSELDVVLGLELGAAGYVTKPFLIRELVARMRAILRRVQPAVSGDFDQQIRVGPAIVNFDRREVTIAGEPVHLSRREFDLLAVLLSPPQQIRTRDELIDRLWPDSLLSDSRTLDTHVHRLRTKLEPDPADPRFIVTVRGVGFRIDPNGRNSAPGR